MTIHGCGKQNPGVPGVGRKSEFREHLFVFLFFMEHKCHKSHSIFSSCSVGCGDVSHFFEMCQIIFASHSMSALGSRKKKFSSRFQD